MSTLQGIGTRMIGEYDWDDNSHYTTNKYFVIGNIPVLPIASYRVISEHVVENTFVVKQTNYQLKRIPIQWKYVFPFLGAIYGTIAALIFLLWFTITTKNGVFTILGIFGIIFLTAFALVKISDLAQNDINNQ